MRQVNTILFDIIHPANVHYFKYIIQALVASGKKVIVTARAKEITYDLLEAEKISYIKMGKNPHRTFGKMLFLLWCEIKTFFIFLKYNPDICLSFGSSYIAHNCFIFRKAHIALDDTEHASLNRKLYLPFTKLILTPESYNLNLGKKHLKFPGHMELFYLTEKYFKPDKQIYKFLTINPYQCYVIFRFVSWSALHDKGQSGFSDQFKIDLVKEMSEKYTVFVSSEGELPQVLEEYRIKIPPHLIHHVLYYSNLFVGEGATMTSECAALGVPAIYVNSLSAGTLENQAKEGLIYSFREEKGVREKVYEILNNPSSKQEARKKLKLLEKGRIDLPAFLTWLVLNYPDSIQIILQDSSWKDKFAIQ